MSDARRLCLARRVAAEIRGGPFCIRGFWWSSLRRLVVGESLFDTPVCFFNPDGRFHRPPTRRALRSFLRATLDEQLDITIRALNLRPHPSAWYVYAQLCVLRPERLRGLGAPPWDLNASWTEEPQELGETTLHYACEYGDPEVVTFLLARGADVHATDRMGRTPLHALVSYRFRDECHMRPLEELRIAGLLLDSGADVNARTTRGETPLFVAAREDMACFLLERGADPTIRDVNGWTFSEYYDADQDKVVQGPWRLLPGACALDRALVPAESARRRRL